MKIRPIHYCLLISAILFAASLATGSVSKESASDEPITISRDEGKRLVSPEGKFYPSSQLQDKVDNLCELPTVTSAILIDVASRSNLASCGAATIPPTSEDFILECQETEDRTVTCPVVSRFLGLLSVQYSARASVDFTESVRNTISSEVFEGGFE